MMSSWDSSSISNRSIKIWTEGEVVDGVLIDRLISKDSRRRCFDSHKPVGSCCLLEGTPKLGGEARTVYIYKG